MDENRSLLYFFHQTLFSYIGEKLRDFLVPTFVRSNINTLRNIDLLKKKKKRLWLCIFSCPFLYFFNLKSNDGFMMPTEQKLTGMMIA